MTGRRTKSNLDIYEAVQAMLPKDRKRAADVMVVSCAAACIDAGLDDDTAVTGLVRALETLRERGAGEGVH
ncbi:hypothetical protein [Rhizobium sp. LC145]|uniref:hypothetical protein n=1 Tax=Rhizobium sp. LC145 TaxID=1120688 RepID=UPI000A614FA1|nr:hypothetical protein [Rhizobium sp. LC145]TKT58335.1 hypothetical protein FDR95_12055 [Rhizobiaceae bacterium LC148]